MRTQRTFRLNRICKYHISFASLSLGDLAFKFMNKVYVIVSNVTIGGGHGEGSEAVTQLLGKNCYSTYSDALLQLEKVRRDCGAWNAEVLELNVVA
jgi:hypothetical protein